MIVYLFTILFLEAIKSQYLNFGHWRIKRREHYDVPSEGCPVWNTMLCEKGVIFHFVGGTNQEEKCETILMSPQRAGRATLGTSDWLFRGHNSLILLLSQIYSNFALYDTYWGEEVHSEMWTLALLSLQESMTHAKFISSNCKHKSPFLRYILEFARL